MANLRHIPVLINEVLEYLKPEKGQIIMDATLGLGGHSEKIAEKIDSNGKLLAFDQDEENLRLAKKNLNKFSDRIKFFHNNFANLEEALSSEGIKEIDAALFDLGIASTHIDEAERGFSFNKDGPLDMRMDKTQRLTAADIVNKYSEKRLADIIFYLGEERQSRKIARAIVMNRKQKKIETTLHLSEIISDTLKWKGKKAGKIHPATKTFMALRIQVNDEIEVLRKGLSQAFNMLKPGGRLVVISFHSLEDREVKRLFKYLAAKCVCGPEVWKCECEKEVQAKLLTKKPIIPTEEEKEENPRARSAKLRAIEKTNVIPDQVGIR